MDENYAKAMQGIAMTRALIKNVYDTMRQGLESGDDPVIWMHNLAAEYGRQDAFKTGGSGAAMFTVAVYLLAEAGYFEPKAIEAESVAEKQMAEVQQIWVEHKDCETNCDVLLLIGQVLDGPE